MKRATRRARGPGEVSLSRALSKLGLASRSEAVALIESGRVRVNGRPALNPAAVVVPERVRIQIDGVTQKASDWVLVALHKPNGVVTTRRDPDGRKTVYDFLEELHAHVIPVGRLDAATTGLLLLTSDTQLANWLTDPANHVVRTYVVTVRGRVAETTIRDFERGIVDRDERLSARRIEAIKTSGRETHLRVQLIEGKNREIRRMFSSAGHEVTRLKRIAFGGIELGDLPPGRWHRISPAETRRAFPEAPVRQLNS